MISNPRLNELNPSMADLNIALPLITFHIPRKIKITKFIPELMKWYLKDEKWGIRPFCTTPQQIRLGKIYNLYDAGGPEYHWERVQKKDGYGIDKCLWYASRGLVIGSILQGKQYFHNDPLYDMDCIELLAELYAKGEPDDKRYSR